MKQKSYHIKEKNIWITTQTVRRQRLLFYWSAHFFIFRVFQTPSYNAGSPALKKSTNCIHTSTTNNIAGTICFRERLTMSSWFYTQIVLNFRSYTCSQNILFISWASAAWACRACGHASCIGWWAAALTWPCRKCLRALGTCGNLLFARLAISTVATIHICGHINKIKLRIDSH